MAGAVSGIKFNKRGEDFDATLFKGATVSFSLTWGGEASPIDVTGFDAKMQVYELDGTTKVFDFSSANSRVAVGDTNGLITFTMSKTDSAALAAGKYLYAIEVIDATSRDMPVMSGRLEVVPGVF